MKIHALCMVKNEVDVISQSLTAASRWCDAIYVWDNGSTDGTWETVLDLSGRLSPVVPDRRDDRPFKEALRRELFEAHRATSAEGDWWCVLDADEFYVDDPRSFLREVPPTYDEVWAASFEFYFTEKDLARYEADPSAYADDVPVETKVRHYLNNWSEPRFFKFSRHRVWRRGGWPEDLGPPYPRRIRLKHYQYRSPQQIQRRLDTRSEPMRRGHFPHERLPDWKTAMVDTRGTDFTGLVSNGPSLHWRDRVLDSAVLIEDLPGRDYVVVEHALPPIPTAKAAWVRWVRRRARPLRRLAARALRPRS